MSEVKTEAQTEVRHIEREGEEQQQQEETVTYDMIHKKKLFILGGKAFPRVKWWNFSSLWKLYAHCFVLILTSRTTGLDSFLMSSMQMCSVMMIIFNDL